MGLNLKILSLTRVLLVACWFATQEVAGSNTHFLQKYFSSTTDSVDSTEFI